MNPIVIDLETSGLDPHRHGILSIGAKKASSGAEFYIECRLSEVAESDPEALAINGFTEEQARDPRKPSDATALAEFLRFADWQEHTGPLVLAGMNVGHFDLPFMEILGHRFGFRGAFSHRSLDLHSIVAVDMIRSELPVPVGGLSTSAVYRALDLPEEPKPHHALTGARCAFAAFQKLFTQK